MREGMSAASRRSGQGYWDCDADAAALPGMPLLHDRVPLSCALLQLVGSGVACGNGEEPESGSCSTHAWGRGEVQSVPRAVAFGEGEGRECGKAGNRSRRLCRGSLHASRDIIGGETNPPLMSRLAWRLARPAPFDLATWPTRTMPPRKTRALLTHSACWRASGRSQRFITNRRRPG